MYDTFETMRAVTYRLVISLFQIAHVNPLLDAEVEDTVHHVRQQNHVFQQRNKRDVDTPWPTQMTPHTVSSNDTKRETQYNQSNQSTTEGQVVQVNNFSDMGTVESTVPLWQDILDTSQLVMVIIGLCANIMTVITLVRNGKVFSNAILILLCHQSIVDASACVCGALVLVQPFMWLPGNYYLDVVVCYGWHSQALYWQVIFISIWNLVALAFERFLAVCHPFKHQALTSKRLYNILVVIYTCSFIANSGSYIQTHLVSGDCLPEFFLQGDAGSQFYYGFAISTFFTFYALPCSLFILFYGMVVITFHRRSRTQLASSRIIDKATSELTKTAVVVTVIFIIAIGYDLWYYVLGYAGLVEYIVNSTIQKIGVWLSSFNSVANPFVYALLMPAYRRSVKSTFCKLCG